MKSAFILGVIFLVGCASPQVLVSDSDQPEVLHYKSYKPGLSQYRSVEVHVLVDPIDNKIISKEKIVYNHKGAYSHEVRRRKIK